MEDQVGEVRREHQFDKNNLQRYLIENLKEFPKGDGELQIQQYRYCIIFNVHKCANFEL